MGVVYTGFDPAFQDPLDKFLARARAQGYSPELISGVRSAYGWPGMKGSSQADLYSQLGKPGGPAMAAPPGQSPHQYGTAADLSGVPESWLLKNAPDFGLHGIASDPNHIELANWQKTAAAQPASAPWSSVTAGTNLNSVPSASPATPAAAPAAPSSPAPDAPAAAGMLAQGDVGGALGAAGASPMVQSGIKELAGGASPQAAAPPPMPVPQLQSNQNQVAQMAPQMLAQLLMQQRRPPGLSLGGYYG